MKELVSILLFLLFIITATTSRSQQILLVENTHSLKNIKFYKGDHIRLKIASDKRTVSGEITCITKSTVCVGSWEEVEFSDIKAIYQEVNIIRIIRAVLLTGGVAYFSIDTFNRLINNDAPVVLMETLAISGGMVGLNFLLIPLSQRRYKMSKWKLSLIDFDHLGMPSLTAPGTTP